MFDSHKGLKIAGISISVLAVLVVAGTAVMAIFQETVEPNEVGVFQYRPYLIGTSSVDKHVLMGPDRAYMWPSTKLWRVNVAPQTLTAHAEDFMTRDRVPLDFDLSVTVRVATPASAPDLVQKFGTGPLTVFKTLVMQLGDDPKTKTAPTGELMSFLRDQVRHHHSAVFIAAQNENGTASDGAAEVENATRDHINAFLKKNGAGMIQVDNIALGRANPPDGVRKTIEATAQQAQEIKTQQERKRAAEARALAEVAVAAADNAYLKAMNYDLNQYIEIQRIAMYREVCKGNVMCVFSTGQTPLALPVPTQRASAPQPQQTAAKQ